MAYRVVAWTQTGAPTVTNIAVTNEDVGSSKGGNVSDGINDPGEFVLSSNNQTGERLHAFLMNPMVAARAWSLLKISYYILIIISYAATYEHSLGSNNSGVDVEWNQGFGSFETWKNQLFTTLNWYLV
ncbi:hypothetical protein Tco_1183907 [Tanacetum coccineum]